MSLNIATIGFAADSSQLKSAKTALDQLAPSAKKAETASEQLASGMSRVQAAAAGVVGASTRVAAAIRGQESAAEQAALAQARLSAASAAASGHLNTMNMNVGNLAAQFQDIGVTAAMGMNPLMIALQQGTQISAVLAQNGANAASAVSQLGAAFKSVVSPLSLATIGIVAASAALLQMVPWSKVAQSSLRAVASGLDEMKQSLVTAAPAVAGVAAAWALWNIPVIIGGVRALTVAVYGLVTAQVALAASNPFLLFGAGVAAAVAAIAVFRKELANALGFDLVAAAKNTFNWIISAAVGAFSYIATAWENLKLKFTTGGEGIDPFAAWRKAFETDWIAKGMEITGKGIDALTGKLRTWADALGGTSKAYQKLQEHIKSQIAMAQMEYNSIGMTTAAAEALRSKTEWLNKAREDHIKMTPAMIASIDVQAAALGRIKAATEKVREAFDFTKDVVKGFVTDMRTSLQRGESFLKAFSDAALNILNKVTDKLIDGALDMLLKPMFGGGGAGGGIMSAISGLFGGFKDGGTFGTAGIDKFAKGGTFTNSIVTRPTAFKFADGGGFSLGQMGERGPEGVLPLKRGPDGSLGVTLNGVTASQGTGNTNIVINNNASGIKVREEHSPAPDGGMNLTFYVERIVDNGLGTGRFDRSMRARYGGTPVKSIGG